MGAEHTWLDELPAAQRNQGRRAGPLEPMRLNVLLRAHPVQTLVDSRANIEQALCRAPAIVAQDETSGDGFPAPTLHDFFPEQLLFEGTPFALTRITMIMLLMTAVLAVIVILAFRKPRVVPTGLQNVVEYAITGMDKAITGEVLGAMRKAKSEAQRSMRAPVERLVVRDSAERIAALQLAIDDLKEAGSVRELVLVPSADASDVEVELADDAA